MGCSTTEEYDPISDKWTKKADMPTPRWGLSTSLVNGKIYAIGGVQYPKPLATVEEYDPVADTWTKKADMPTARWYHHSSVVNGKIYVIGGTPNDFATIYSVVEEYDPIMNTWSRKTDMPTARASLCTNVVGDKIYAIGGSGKGNALHNPLGIVEEYDPVADAWTKKADMLTARFCLTTCTLDGKIYVFGGCGLGYKTYSSTEEYDTGFKGDLSIVNAKGKLTMTWGEIRRAK